jgi:site-specific recombinase
MTAFWSGFWAGANYAPAFVIVMLLHWTVATKQPAMTAPALAVKLPAAPASRSRAEGFVDEVVHLIRSQVAGIVGNLALCGPLVLAVQWAGRGRWLGAPLVGEKPAHYVLHSLTLLGPTALFAAFTGVLLFASSLIAGWAENWFVFHRLDSAIAWNPRIVARWVRRARSAGPPGGAPTCRAGGQRVAGLDAGPGAGLADFVGLPLEVRHVTLSTGQLAAALGALGRAAAGSRCSGGAWRHSP